MTPKERIEIAKMAAAYFGEDRIRYINRQTPLDFKERKIIAELADYIDREGYEE